jgi:hypothetical protein
MGVGVHSPIHSSTGRYVLPSSALKERLGHHKTEGSNQVFLPKFFYIQYIYHICDKYSIVKANSIRVKSAKRKLSTVWSIGIV